MILLVHSDINQAQSIAEKLRLKVANSSSLSQLTQHEVTISLDVTSVTDSDDIDSIFKRADSALYNAKSIGKNVVVLGRLD